MEHRFGEDENELPYLESQKKDNDLKDAKAREEMVDDIVCKLHISDWRSLSLNSLYCGSFRPGTARI